LDVKFSLAKENTMSKKLSVLLIVVLLLAVASSALAGPVSSQLTADELARVKKGEIIVKNKIDENSEQGYGVAYGVMKGTKEQFWSVITDYGNYLDIYPRLEKVSLLKKQGNSVFTVEFNMDATLTTMTYTTESTISAGRDKMTWKLVENRPHKYMTKSDGWWQLEEIEPGVILAEYRVIIGLDLGIFSGVASKVVMAMSKDDLPDVVECTRKRMESGGAWKRPRK